VSWIDERQVYALAVTLYGASFLYSVFLWRKGFRQANRVNYVLLLAGFLLHTSAMLKRGFSLAHCPVNNLFEAILFVQWTIVASYLVLGLWSKIRFLGAFASPILLGMGIFALMPALDPPYGETPNFTPTPSTWGSIHAAMVLLSFGSFGLASIAGIMYLTQEHNLKLHKLQAIVSKLPSIERLERVIAFSVLAGFALLSAGLVFTVTHLHRPNVLADPIFLWGLFVWMLYLAQMIYRWRFSRSGRRVAWGAVASFAFVLLTFWGFYLLSDIHQK
jgi:HemX protein